VGKKRIYASTTLGEEAAEGLELRGTTKRRDRRTALLTSLSPF